VSFQVAHASRQDEAGVVRDVEMEMACVAVESLARLVAAAPLGTGVRTQGFLARKGKSSRQLVLHVTGLEFTQESQESQDTQGDRDASTQQRT
jgi:primosomal replication protein N